MINSRTKGRAGEQDVAKILREELGIEVKRNWAEQAHHGGADLVGVDGWSIEVKRSKKYSKKWWEQSLNQSLTASDGRQQPWQGKPHLEQAQIGYH
jgi:Holliday junction resolvase-like predicted endonuclease